MSNIQNQDWCIGVDLGGTKIEAIALSSKGQEQYRLRVPSPQGNYGATLQAIVALISQIASTIGHNQIKGVGLGMPGSLSPVTGLVRNSNSTWLNGKPLGIDLQALLPYPLFIENDANCFVLSEAADGAGHSTVFGIIIGTGVGGGLVLNGTLIGGRNAIGGEWGHNQLPWQTESERANARQCYCGRIGCIETFLSGPAFEVEFARKYDRHIDAKTIALLAHQGDQQAKLSLSIYAERLARSLATIINVVDPDVIVFGGGMSNIIGLTDMVSRYLSKHVFADHHNTPLKRNRWGDSSGVRGAAQLPFRSCINP